MLTRTGGREKGYILGEKESSKPELFDRLISKPGWYLPLQKLFLTGDGNATALKGESHSLLHREVGVGVVKGCHDDELLTYTDSEQQTAKSGMTCRMPVQNISYCFPHPLSFSTTSPLSHLMIEG